jgi:hypothetical protein
MLIFNIAPALKGVLKINLLPLGFGAIKLIFLINIIKYMSFKRLSN